MSLPDPDFHTGRPGNMEISLLHPGKLSQALPGGLDIKAKQIHALSETAFFYQLPPTDHVIAAHRQLSQAKNIRGSQTPIDKPSGGGYQ